MKNYYVILGVPENCRQEDIKKAYRKLARKYHPDASHEDSSEQFRDIQEAYENIGNAAKRKHYDEELSKFRERQQKTAASVQRNRFEEQHAGWSVPETRDFASFFNHFFVNGVLEIELTQQEAARGKSIPIRIPFNKECPQCQGFGIDFWLLRTCGYCKGSGVVHNDIAFTLQIPPGVADGTEMVINVQGFGAVKIVIWIS